MDEAQGHRSAASGRGNRIEHEDTQDRVPAASSCVPREEDVPLERLVTREKPRFAKRVWH
jgi:hypothetical protein